VSEAHGQGAALQFNYLLERGALIPDEATGKIRVDFEEMASGVRALVRDICVLQARGDYDGTSRFLERYGVLSPTLEAGLARLEGIPVDLRPSYPAAK
jgi:hypothetical protein